MSGVNDSMNEVATVSIHQQEILDNQTMSVWLRRQHFSFVWNCCCESNRYADCGNASKQKTHFPERMLFIFPEISAW